MNIEELGKFLEDRKPSPQLTRFNPDKLFCYGCAHGRSGVEFPGAPSGERPCCSCIRNPDRENTLPPLDSDDAILIDNLGNARIFDPFFGTLYNGAPTKYFPMDNYITLDYRDQEDWLEKHPVYAKPITFRGDRPVVIEGEN